MLCLLIQTVLHLDKIRICYLQLSSMSTPPPITMAAHLILLAFLDAASFLDGWMSSVSSLESWDALFLVLNYDVDYPQNRNLSHCCFLALASVLVLVWVLVMALALSTVMALCVC